MDNVDSFLCVLVCLVWYIEKGEKKSRFICRKTEAEQNSYCKKMSLIGLLVKEKDSSFTEIECWIFGCNAFLMVFLLHNFFFVVLKAKIYWRLSFKINFIELAQVRYVWCLNMRFLSNIMDPPLMFVHLILSFYIIVWV